MFRQGPDFHFEISGYSSKQGGDNEESTVTVLFTDLVQALVLVLALAKMVPPLTITPPQVSEAGRHYIAEAVRVSCHILCC